MWCKAYNGSNLLSDLWGDISLTPSTAKMCIHPDTAKGGECQHTCVRGYRLVGKRSIYNIFILVYTFMNCVWMASFYNLHNLHAATNVQWARNTLYDILQPQPEKLHALACAVCTSHYTRVWDAICALGSRNTWSLQSAFGCRIM